MKERAKLKPFLTAPLPQEFQSYVDRPFGAPLPIVHRLDLPCPPSLNSIWRNGKGRTYKSAKYQSWLGQADMAVMAAGGLRGRRTITCAFEAQIFIKRKATRADLDNIGTKALFDWAQSRGYIANDKNCIGYSVKWALDEAPMTHDCVMMLRSIGDCGLRPPPVW